MIEVMENPMDDELYEWVERAQGGDKEALQNIISLFKPAIKSATSKIKYDRREDFEQIIIEKMIVKILHYDLHHLPDYSLIFRQLYKDSSRLIAFSERNKDGTTKAST